MCNIMEQFRSVFGLGAWVFLGVPGRGWLHSPLGVVVFRWAGCELRALVVAMLGEL